MSKRRSPSNRTQRDASSGPEPLAGHDEADGPLDQPADEAAPRRWKLIASGLILFHLMAVALPPLAFQTFSLDGPSPLVGTLIRPFAGYGQFLHMDRGYAFFAPDPGPSHLIQAASTNADGTLTERMYPDRNDQWPRLLYHRHFMLAEFLNDSYWPPGPPNEMFESDRAAAELWQQRRGRYEWIRQSMVDHLRSVNEGRDVAIRRLEHGLPGLQEFTEEPIALDDPRLYNVLLDQPVFSDEIAPAPVTTEVIPAPEVGDGGGATPNSLQGQTSDSPASDAASSEPSINKPEPQS
ncbi:hypothetical protein NZK35_31605 [Stieleria sp. ICT_E10.1]|uniref:hypothetical protein n=1 Tax=Stieleria sedimenti TaxID=2976331 RepID=UPI00217F35E7|nr:hypothetical protein [Stieleria sedimenti]MCS7471226.1 hypothetical protein [Stieleria sedimenti]